MSGLSHTGGSLLSALPCSLFCLGIDVARGGHISYWVWTCSSRPWPKKCMEFENDNTTCMSRYRPNPHLPSPCFWPLNPVLLVWCSFTTAISRDFGGAFHRIQKIENWPLISFQVEWETMGSVSPHRHRQQAGRVAGLYWYIIIDTKSIIRRRRGFFHPASHAIRLNLLLYLHTYPCSTPPAVVYV